MTIAAIIATCDRPEMLGRALESVRRQGLVVDEIIVVNDGVSDVRVTGARVLRIGPHAGPGAARNAGAHAATADNLVFLDDDDEWSPDHVATVSALLAHGEVAATALRKHARTGDVKIRPPPPTLNASEWLIQNQGIQGSNLAIRRNVFLNLMGFDELLWCGEDMDFAIRCADNGVRYAMSETPTVTYHAHSGPRITSPDQRHRHAHRTFLAAHGSRMSATQVQAFRERVTALFGVDPGPVPQLVWVLGPPGAGKTTWVTRCMRGRDRVFEFGEAMPWLDGADLGVRTAKRHISAAIRATESQRPEGDRRLFVTTSYFGPEDLGPPQSFEHIVAIVPSEARWRAQLEKREGFVDEQQVREHAHWTTRFGTGARAASAGAE
ncbi:MAG: glycosyltransferase [Myxococcales bacterium]|nr:glycosyltransferase [Myxococcales bacterium]